MPTFVTRIRAYAAVDGLVAEFVNVCHSPVNGTDAVVVDESSPLDELYQLTVVANDCPNVPSTLNPHDIAELACTGIKLVTMPDDVAAAEVTFADCAPCAAKYGSTEIEPEPVPE